MFKRMLITLTATAGLTGLYGLYALVVTPRLEPRMLAAPQPSWDERDAPQAKPPPGNLEDAERYLKEAPWAARAKYQIRLAKGVLFSETWRPRNEKRDDFEFRPFATILFNAPASDSEDGDAEEKPPITLVSERGLIRFSAKFDPVNSQVGRVIGGKLEGKVTVTGPDGLIVHGRDVFFDESRMELRSDFPVEYQYQEHHGTAEGLKVELLPSTAPPGPDQLLAVGGFRRVILTGHVEMNLVSGEGPVHVTCDEGFALNPSEGVAAFQGNVHVNRVTAGDQEDRGRGEYLVLTFEDESVRSSLHTPSSRGDAPAGVVPSVRSNESAGQSGKPNRSRRTRPGESTLTLVRLEFTGPRVELVSQSNDLTVLTPSLIYDVPSRTVKLTALSADSKSKLSDLTSVIVRQTRTGTDISSPYLELTHSEEGQIIFAKGKGAGRLRRRTLGTDTVELSARWQSHFEMQPEPNSEMDRLSLFGRAVIELPARETGLKAEQIQMWYDRPVGGQPTDRLVKREGKSSPRDADIAPSLERRASVDLLTRRDGIDLFERGATVAANETKTRTVPDLGTRGLRPRQLQALENVVLVSPQMVGRSNSLIVDFDDESPQSSQLADDPKSKRRVRPASAESAAGKSKDREKVSSEPLQLTADRIRAKVRLASDSIQVAGGEESQAELTEVWTEGKVEIKQAREADGEPLHLTGDRLHMRNASRDGQQVLHVSGQPAEILMQGFDIKGKDVFLDRPNNRTWIEGAGELRIPVKNDFDGRKLTSSALLTVWWKEKMLFDGQTATFVDDVKADLNDSRLKCSEMEVVLSQRLSFQEVSGPLPQAEVRRVICKDGVEIDHTQFTDKGPAEIRHGRFAKMTLDQLSGQMEGVGPGEIALWRPGQGKRAALAPRASAQANRPLETDTANWDFTRITFQGKTVGNLRDRQTKFQDRVHIVYGPVAHPLDTIDPDHLPKNGGDMESDTLQILQRKETASQKPYVELLAKGNAKLEGRAFNARADEITFDESKLLYTLRATGNRQVTIWRQTTPDGEPSEASAKSMRFIPSQNFLRSDQTTGIRGTN